MLAILSSSDLVLKCQEECLHKNRLRGKHDRQRGCFHLYHGSNTDKAAFLITLWQKTDHLWDHQSDLEALLFAILSAHNFHTSCSEIQWRIGDRRDWWQEGSLR